MINELLLHCITLYNRLLCYYHFQQALSAHMVCPDTVKHIKMLLFRNARERERAFTI